MALASCYRVAIVGAMLGLFGGCTTLTERGSWGGGAHLPNGSDLKHAAISAAKDPMTWAPLDRPEAVFFSAEVEPGQDDKAAIGPATSFTRSPASCSSSTSV